MSRGAAPVTLLRATVDDGGNLRNSAGDPLAALTPGTQVEVRVVGRFTPTSIRHDVLLDAVILAAVLVAFLAMAGHNWPWTGFRGNESLWDWLSILALPVAIASMPIRLAMSYRALGRRWRLVWLGFVIALGVTIVGGYGLGWSWTGFGGKFLWDWLHLVLFPVVLVFLPEWLQRGSPVSRVGAVVAAVLAAAFALVVIGGYYVPWAWTGFTGNTFREWLDLLIAPFLLPAACRWFQVHWTNRAAMGTVIPDGPLEPQDGQPERQVGPSERETTAQTGE